jgi:prolyl 4-hydroxylase
MAWVAAEGGLEGGGTAFPELPTMSDDRRWCQFIECGEEGDGGGKEEGETRGVIFKAVPGNAVFWENFMADGSGVGYGETVHAGLPVKKGVKVGLNIWSWGRI